MEVRPDRWNETQFFFRGAVVSILLYGCTTWRQDLTKQQLYDHLPPITKTVQVRRTRHAGHCGRNRDELINDVLPWTSSHRRAKAGRPVRTYIQQLCADKRCSLEDLPEEMDDREWWRERARDIRADGKTWWWWWYVCTPLNGQTILFMGSKQELSLRFRVDLRVMAMKEYSTFPKVPVGKSCLYIYK